MKKYDQNLKNRLSLEFLIKTLIFLAEKVKIIQTFVRNSNKSLILELELN